MLAVATAGALAVAGPTTELGEGLLAQGRTAVSNAIELIRSRSPGQRTRAHLIKTKLEHRARPRPVARALPRVRRPAAAAPALLAPPPPAIPLAFAGPELVPVGAVPGPFPVYDFASALPCPCIFAFVPELLRGGGVVFGPPLPGGGGVIPPPPPPPAIPEPGPWALMILGFGVTGWAWRRRRTLIAVITHVPLLFYDPVIVPAR